MTHIALISHRYDIYPPQFHARVLYQADQVKSYRLTSLSLDATVGYVDNNMTRVTANQNCEPHYQSKFTGLIMPWILSNKQGDKNTHS